MMQKKLVEMMSSVVIFVVVVVVSSLVEAEPDIKGYEKTKRPPTQGKIKCHLDAIFNTKNPIFVVRFQPRF